ncbi:hypothetical protein [Desnuesiella massiliensis]|uniref:hypothetical protein n=1 Tax=Desnuesiella massiliensis TaxID=1650662 RepID=UPI0006E3E396|nr:hypothetical protein [Desnuesiella massiliensis]
MKHLKQRNIRIVDELMTFCYKYGTKKIQIDILEEEEYTVFALSAEIHDLDQNVLDNVSKLLNAPRLHEMEEYYWNLTGDNDTDSELALVGMMTDEVFVNYMENKILNIILKRKI